MPDRHFFDPRTLVVLIEAGGTASILPEQVDLPTLALQQPLDITFQRWLRDAKLDRLFKLFERARKPNTLVPDTAVNGTPLPRKLMQVVVLARASGARSSTITVVLTAAADATPDVFVVIHGGRHTSNMLEEVRVVLDAVQGCRCGRGALQPLHYFCSRLSITVLPFEI